MSCDPSKNIVICIDGTGDWAGKNQTNVATIFDHLDKGQRVYYDGGVGTLADASVLVGFSRTFLKLLDLATATSLRNNILNAYAYLVEHYKPGDQIFVFGFSRGAYACRLLASLVHSFGILCPEHKNLIPYLWQSISSAERDIDGYFGEARRIKRKFSVVDSNGVRKPMIQFMGLFDTVSSVGIFDRFKVFPYTDSNPSVRIVRHAVSLRESRNAFPELLITPTTLTDKTQQDVQEVWFEGVHRDIGGGSIDEKNDSQEATLRWMLDAAKKAGLCFVAPPAVKPASMKAPGFDPYVFVGLYPMNMFDPSLAPEKKRKKGDKRVPANLSLWLLLKLPIGILINCFKKVTGNGDRILPLWPRDSFFRWYWPNFKHFRPVPLGAFVWSAGSVLAAPDKQMSIWQTFKNYLKYGKRPVVGALSPVTSLQNLNRPEFPKAKLNFPDFVGIMLGVTFAFLILNRGVPWPWDFPKPFGESWSESLLGYSSSTWVIVLFIGFVLQQGFAQWIDQALPGRLLNTLVPLLGSAAAVTVFLYAQEKEALIYGGCVGLLLALLALFPIHKEVVRADRAVALCFVPWFLIMVCDWIVLRIVAPAGTSLYNWLFGCSSTFTFEKETHMLAWVLAGLSFLIALINVVQDRTKKKSV